MWLVIVGTALSACASLGLAWLAVDRWHQRVLRDIDRWPELGGGIIGAAERAAYDELARREWAAASRSSPLDALTNDPQRQYALGLGALAQQQAMNPYLADALRAQQMAQDQRAFSAQQGAAGNLAALLGAFGAVGPFRGHTT